MASESDVWDLWQQHTAASVDHQALLQSCRDFITEHPRHTLVPMVRQFEVWHLMKTGQLTEAKNSLTAMLSLPANAFNDDARQVAQGWLTRLDREIVADALKEYYNEKVAYPQSLSQLSSAGRLPPRDRFGKAWVYSLTGYSKLPGFGNQKYSLESEDLGDLSDYRKALALDYAARIETAPVRMVTASGSPPSVELNLNGRQIPLGAGQAINNISMSFIGDEIIVLTDGTYWKVFQRP